MKSQINRFKTPDQLSLNSVIFEPEKQTEKVAIFLHGNGNNDIFDYYNDTKEIGSTFCNLGISYFAFNNRGSRYINTFKFVDEQGKKHKIWGGMTYELIRDCVNDIDGAIDYLKSLGYSDFFLIGGSTGANKAVLYNYIKPENEIKKFILSAGGDDMGVYLEMIGKEKFYSLIDVAKRKIAENRGMEITLELGAPFSYRSILDTLNPDGDYNIFQYYEANNGQISKKVLFREIKSIIKPTLVMYGELDEYCKPNTEACVNILKRNLASHNNFQYEILPGRDHSLSKGSSNLKEVALLEANFLIS